MSVILDHESSVQVGGPDSVTVSAGKHTPGPWRIAKLFSGWAIKCLDNGYGSTVCIESDHEDYNALPQTDANARLIAAAPEMLAALKQAAVWVAYWRSLEPIDTNRVNAKVLGIEIEAAITKATGGQS